MTDLVRPPGRRSGVRGDAPGPARRRQPGRPAAPRRGRPVPAGRLRRRHRRRRASPDAEAWVVRKTVDRGGRVPRYLEPLRAGHVVLGHREPLGRATHLDRRRAGRRDRGRHHVGALRHELGSSEPDPGRVRRDLRRGHRRPPGARPASTTPIRPTVRGRGFAVAAAVHRLRRARPRQQRRVLADRRGGAGARDATSRAPLRAEVQHRTAIERGATVEVTSRRRRRRAGAVGLRRRRRRDVGRGRAAYGSTVRVVELPTARSAACRDRRGSDLAGRAEVLEVGVGLALGHLAPRARLEELVADSSSTVASPSSAAAVRSVSRRSSWWSRISSARPARSSNGCPWAGSTRRDALEAGDLVERGEELGERVGAGDEAGDVGRDRGQHVVAGEHDARWRGRTGRGGRWCARACAGRPTRAGRG